MSIGVAHLKAFLSVAREGSVTAAAAVLGLGQPAVSRRVLQLEAHLGVALFDRSGPRLRLTRHGDGYRTTATTAVQAVEDALHAPDRRHRPLRLVHAWGALGSRTASIAREWSDRHPDDPLELYRTDDCLSALEHACVDAAVVRDLPARRGLRRERLGSERRFVALPARHPLAEQRQLGLDQLLEETIVVSTVSGTTGPDLWPGPAPARWVEVDGVLGWLEAIVDGRGVGITSDATMALLNGPDITYRFLRGTPRVTPELVWSASQTHPLVEELAEFITDRLEPAPGAAGRGTVRHG